MFGNADEVPQNENTTLSSRSPYGVAKIAAHHAVRLYREAYGLFACAGILFNHESPRRGDNFVTRKITLYVAKLAKAIKEGKVTYDKKNRTWDISDFEPLSLGNLDARRDWGFAGCYVDAMYRMLQLDKPDDFVIATGKTNSIKRFLRHAFGTIGIDYEPFVVQNPKYMRPADINQLVGDASKAKKILGWRSNKDFEQLVREMVKSDLKSLGCSRHTATMTIWGKQCQGS
jgi:GDPmannose 4,6-dehydratase